ncbi:phosphatase PAP2 family protein [Thermoactinomyces intermedius]|jgi:undecaprenyl-diphosphatase|uniref:Phosphatase PAP2 family protein n=1 Tax=Thermoactinomyces intermedius TaxID=2024 RepID=A0A8I1A3L5_THEIN|nr:MULTISPECIES: phosphatase PAP2 family protein [Thermoactinomyces]MBA4547602.1 phosphatase PAP2 family protein [Thermoactinomyces intermedius]MBA4836242.1 phosphatase PAP2 family protein [Thermoactinomyces intermedius]MBH8594169.1 phosphatase PAP2 family protein [Thermoactinomyces intermedius]MBH8601005.1 phosphatase PAP2 family protein [Thermoactinomyces sp. CICC 23799]
MKSLTSWLSRSDQFLIQLVNCHFKCRLLDWIMPRVTHLGGATATIVFLLGWILFMPKPVKGWALEALIALGTSHLAVRFLKKYKPRIRPYLKLTHLHTFPNPLTDYSFPSGHTTAAFSIAMTFALHSSVMMMILIPYAMIIGFSRMYLALHYPTDVLIGTFLGSSFAFIVVNLFERI